MSNNYFKYRKIAAYIKDQIFNGTFVLGDKLPSEISLSEQFNVSRQTVRKSIAELTKYGFLEPRHGSGTFVVYDPIKKKLKQSMIIGVISTYLDDYIFPSSIRGMDRILSKNGYSIQLLTTMNNIEKEAIALEKLRELGVDGIIVEPTKSSIINPNTYTYLEIAKEGIPVLFFNAYYPELDFPYVALDDREVGRFCTEYLIQNGHKKIAGIFKSDDIQGELRYKGFLDIMHKYKLKIDLDKYIWYTTEDLSNLFSVNRKQIVKALNNTTAFFCYNDIIAFELIKFLEMINIRVPEDISVISVDNSSLSKISSPNITSVKHPKSLLGELVAKNIIKMIETNSLDGNFLFTPQLVEGESVKRIELL